MCLCVIVVVIVIMMRVIFVVAMIVFVVVVIFVRVFVLLHVFFRSRGLCPLLCCVWCGLRLVDACVDGVAGGDADGIAARWCDGWTTSGSKCVLLMLIIDWKSMKMCTRML